MSDDDIEMIGEESHDSYQDESSSSFVGLVRGWTREEKFRLLGGIKSFGSENTEAIQELVKTKSKEEVNSAIDHYKGMASKKVPARKGKKTAPSQIPLSNWAKILNENLEFADLQNESATALRLIAEYEDLPNPILTGNIKFKDMYLYLADAIEGKLIPAHKPEFAFIQKCLLESALCSKSFKPQTQINYAIEEMTINQEVKYFTRPTSSCVVASLRHLIDQKPYNPFNMPESTLEPSDDS